MASSLKWWDGYNGQSVVIIDDFRYASVGDVGGLSYLLRLLDRYDSKVEIKGGCRAFLAEHVIITCPFSPIVAFTYGKHTDNPQVDEDIGQLIRRLSQVVELRVLDGKVETIDITQ